MNRYISVNRTHIFFFPVHISVFRFREVRIVFLRKFISISKCILPDYLLSVHETNGKLSEIKRHISKLNQRIIVHALCLTASGHAIHSTITVIYKIIILYNSVRFSYDCTAGFYIAVHVKIRAYIVAADIFASSGHTAYITISADST